MKRSCIYLKYKQERENARLLKKSKKQKLSCKVSEPTNKKNAELQQNVRVSLPISHFLNAKNKRCKSINNSVLVENKNDVGELQVPKLVIKMKPSTESKRITRSLRQVRRNNQNKTTTERNENADESNNVIPKKQILRELSVVLTRESTDISKEVESSLEGETKKGVDQTTQCSESPVCMQRIIIPVMTANGTESYRTCYTHDEALSNTEASKDALREPMYLITRAEFEKYDKFRQNGVLQKLEELEEQNLKNSKRITQATTAATEIINLDSDTDNDDKLNQERLNLALSHSEANKTILRALRNQTTNSTGDGITQVSRPARAGTPFSFVNPNFSNAPACVNGPATVSVPTCNATPSNMRSSTTTALSNSQIKAPSPKKLVHNNQQSKDFIISRQAYDGNNQTRNEVKNIGQGNDRPNEVNLNTLADTANNLNKLVLAPVVASLRKDYQLRQNQLAQRQREKAKELQSHKYMMNLSQLLPPKLKPPPTLSAQLQPPQSEPYLSAQLTQMQPPCSQPSHQQRPKIQQQQRQLQQPQPEQGQPHYSQSSQPQLTVSQPSHLQQIRRLQPPSTQTQRPQLQPHYSKPTQQQQSTKSQPRLPNPPETQLSLQQPPPLPPPKLQPSQMQFPHPPPYPPLTQVPHSQWSSFYGAQQWQQNFYSTQQQQYPQQNGQYMQRQHNYPNAYRAQNQQTNKTKRGDCHLHPGDPRKPPQSWPTTQTRSSYSRIMPYEDNHQNSQKSSYSNYYPQQMHWNNPNHYW